MSAPLVLVADDDPDIVALVRVGLERVGIEVMSAPDGHVALGLAERRTPDAAVLDVMMPRIDGLELTRRLRASEATRRMPILILTAAVQESAVEAAVEAGANGHMAKPFSPRALATRVEALLQDAGAAA